MTTTTIKMGFDTIEINLVSLCRQWTVPMHKGLTTKNIFIFFFLYSPVSTPATILDFEGVAALQVMSECPCRR